MAEENIVIYEGRRRRFEFFIGKTDRKSFALLELLFDWIWRFIYLDYFSFFSLYFFIMFFSLCWLF
jgi:hypothetical protein